MKAFFKNELLSEAFERNGYVIVDCLDASELQRLLALHKSFVSTLKGDFCASIMSPNKKYRRKVDLEIKKVFRNKVSDIFSDWFLSSCGYVIKKACSPKSELPIHQDWSFVDEEKYSSIGLWCPLIDVDEQNGCIRLLKGSHKLNTKPRGQTTPQAYKNLFASLDRSAFTNIRMKAGQLLFQSHRLFHGSNSNMSPIERPAAYGILMPKGSKPKFYYQDLEVYPNKLEEFDVDHRFFTSYVPGTRPVGYKSRGFINYEFDPIMTDQII